MTRKSKRELERAVEDLNPDRDYDGPDEIVIRRYVVPTGWSEDQSDEGKSGCEGPTKDPQLEQALRMYREGGDWHAEELGEAEL